MLLIDVGQNNWGHADLALESSLLGVLLVRDLGAQERGELGGADEGHDVGVVLEHEHLLVKRGLIVGGRSNLDDGTLSQMWELQFESKGIEGLTGGISELKFVSVLIKFKNLKDLGNDVKVTTCL